MQKLQPCKHQEWRLKGDADDERAGAEKALPIVQVVD